jgi:hypothetical protein
MVRMAPPLSRRTRCYSPIQAARTSVAVALLALSCSAPVDEEADGPPEFIGNPGLAPTQTSNPASPQNGNSPGSNAPGAAPSVPGASNANSPPSSGAAGSSSEPTGAAPVGLDPGQSAPSQGAAGSSMTAPSPGAGGSSFEPDDPDDDPASSDPAPAGDPPGDTPPPVDPPQQPTPTLPPPAQPTPQPPPNAGCAGQFICDGFENAAPGASPNSGVWRVIANYTPTPQSPNVQVSAANAHSGAQALRVVGASARNGIVASLPTQTYFMRAWIQADAVPLGPVFIGLGSDQNSETRLRISASSYAAINTVGPGDAIHPGAATSGNCADCVTLAPNRWFCAELFIDNAGRNATLWIDGVEAASIANGDGGWPVQPASPQMFLGSMGLQGGQTAVWIDDVAAGPQRIGCN